MSPSVQAKPILHGRDHCRGGPDPIPCLPPAISGSFAERIMAHPSLVGYWPMDDPSGNAHDESGNSRPLTPVGTPAYGLAGPFADTPAATAVAVTGTAASGSPTDDSFLGAYAALNVAGGDMTILAYIYPTAYPAVAFGGIASYGSGNTGGLGYNFTYRTDGTVHFGAGSSEAASAVSAPLNAWTMVAGTRDSTNLKVFFNGVLEGTSGTDDIDDVSDNFRVGVTEVVGPFSHYFLGRICQVALFDAALTESELAGIWGGGVGGSSDAGYVLTIDEDGNQIWAPPPTSGGGGGSSPADTANWMPLTTVVSSVPELVWDANNSLIPTFTPI